ncbi:hypothetical protein [Spirillospora sp. NPDC047279]|uniref:hypothetical protein n=1 Tax=Spirillospora sp. NPDC047279 TaxID=3155478 RepID=UPI0033EE2101
MKAVPLSAAMAILAASCSGNSSAKPTPPTPDLRPIVDSAPYFCDLVPEGAFRRATGLTMKLSPRWSGPQTDNGLCLAFAADREAPLGLNWSFNNGKNVIDRQQRNGEDDSPHPLPPELGTGLAVIQPTAGADPRPNYVIALFKCGKRTPWIRIDFAPVVRGRDAVEDMVAFMRIAEKRFGQIHKCTPKPA